MDKTQKILRNLDHGYFMTHQEQAEAAELIRKMQAHIDFLLKTTDAYSKQIDFDKEYIAGAMRLVKAFNEKISDALVHLQRGSSLDVVEAIRILK